ncbi:pentapeptide repeat-containing protein [Cerasicoccus fimbriatus]|uniref:pentapeptide repeat-containing protein n=1 Tax=Cerasicoccus fimbriatus TaxID=3014554 RepID=UPI0022B5B77F|nr:pentapeptide repeat-containing protein [Cerasicoccus sp. TK19100]
MDKKKRKFLSKWSALSDRQEILHLARAHGFERDGKVVIENCSITTQREEVDLSGHIFKNVSFGHSRFVNCNGEGSVFDSCKFSGSWIAAEKEIKCSWAGAQFANCEFESTSFGPRTLILEGTSFSRCKLVECNFRTGNLPKSEFLDCHLDYTTFRQAILDESSFEGSTLNKVSFEKTELINIDFTNAIFINMDFWGPLDLSKCKGANKTR